jgi:hypothetical protein
MAKAKNNPVPTAEDLCAICRTPYAHLHEVFFGTGNRQKSIKWGMQIRLCYFHHNDPNNHVSNPHFNARVDKQLKEEYQYKFEAARIMEGMGADAARTLFIREFGRNYL